MHIGIRGDNLIQQMAPAEFWSLFRFVHPFLTEVDFSKLHNFGEKSNKILPKPISDILSRIFKSGPLYNNIHYLRFILTTIQVNFQSITSLSDALNAISSNLSTSCEFHSQKMDISFCVHVAVMSHFQCLHLHIQHLHKITHTSRKQYKTLFNVKLSRTTAVLFSGSQKLSVPKAIFY